jgi:ketosteroid isomerase-like protein
MKHLYWLCVLLTVSLVACQPIQPEAAGMTLGAAPNVSPNDPVDVQIANAMSAAPLAIAQAATIMGAPVEEGGAMVVLREGTNNWTCFTDWTASPGNDPMCGDPAFVAWNDALGSGAPQPDVTKVAIGYMLQGGSDPSNTDPSAPLPAAAEDWVNSPPHIHPLLPGGYAPGQFSTDPTTGYPFIMWDGTPYAHLHVPVNLTPFDEPDPKIHNAMSAAPLAIAQDATILDWPTEEGGEMVVLREGTNGWTCVTDWSVSPGNDPECKDAVWTAFGEAYAAGTTPEITQLGISYMLQGGSDPSETDPYLAEPPPGEDWVTTPPHVMFLVPGGFDPADFSTDHRTGEPYIMWEGTPYEHLMVPIASHAEAASAQMALPSESAVIDGVGPSTASDPAQAQAEDEFRAVALAKEQAFYEGDAERVISFYADDAVSVQPETADVVGKAALAEGLNGLFENNQIVGKFTLKRIWVSGDYDTRYGEWEEVVTSKETGEAEHHIGRCFLGWRKIDGEWKVVSEFINFLVPPTPIE